MNTATARSRRSSYAALWSLLAAALLLASAASNAAASAAAATQAQARQVTGTFVGTVSGTDTFVAVVADDRGRRSIRVYLCDGESVTEWLPGKATRSNRARLRSQSGKSTAALRLSERLASGEVTLPGERRARRFRARRATGLAGLYDVTIASGAKAAVTAPKGQKAARLQARIDRQPNLFQDAEPGGYRWIVQADGKTNGSKKGKQSGSGSSGSTIPGTDI